jgi:hypothetical protein
LWTFFKFGTPLTADGGSDYRIGVKVSNVSAPFTIYRSSSTSDWARIIVTDNAATPAAGDQLFILGGKTGSGTGESVEVTMNQTAVTSYGNTIIASGGKLIYGTSASTNYIMETTGKIEIFANGFFWMGNSSTPIPATSTATLLINCASSNQFWINVKAYGELQFVGSPRTSGKPVYLANLTSNTTVGASVFNVDVDTGWLNGDRIYVGTSTRNFSQTEIFTVSSTNSSSITINETAAYVHTTNTVIGTPIINITRNVRFGATNPTYKSSLIQEHYSTSVIRWAHFNALGHSYFSPAFGFYSSLNQAPTSIEVTHSTFETCNGYAVSVSAPQNSNLHSTNFNFGNNCFANCGNEGGASTQLLYFTGNTTGTGANTITLRNIIFIRNNSTNGGSGIFLDVVKNVNIANCIVNGFGSSTLGIYTRPSNARVNNQIDINVENCILQGVGHGVGIQAGSAYTGVVRYANCDINLTVQNAIRDLSYGTFLFENIRSYGCAIFMLLYVGALVKMSNAIVANVSSFSSGTLVSYQGGYLEVHNSSFDGFTTGNFITPIGTTPGKILYSNVLFSNITTEVGNFDIIDDSFSIQSFKHDQTTDNHIIFKTTGRVQRDTTIFNVSSPSIRITPNNAIIKIKSHPVTVPVSVGQSLTVSVKVRKSQAGDGAAYNGSEPRLIVIENRGANISSNTVLDTMTYSNSSWETLTGTTPVASSNSAFEFVVDCDGTAGWINIDDWDV